MNKRSKIVLISVLSVILGVVCLLTGRSLYKPVVPVQGAGPTPVPTVVAYDPTKAEGTAENPFTILEIVPNYSYAQIGYLIDGQEPVKVYGTGGILENAQAGYRGAYEFLETLSEFTVRGPKGDLSGAGEGTGGNSRVIYTFEDEWSKYPEIATSEWVKSADKIERVTGYYTIATSDQLDDTGLMKYELAKKTTTNASDTSGINKEIYEIERVWTGFRTRQSGESGDRYNRVNEKIDNSGSHRWAPGESGEALKNYSRYSTGGRNKTYYYERNDSGQYIYYNGYMYEANNKGDYVKSYSEGYYVYIMKEAGTNPSDETKTYYIKNGKLGYDDNAAYFDGVFALGNSILIEGVAFDYKETGMEYFYTYTLEEEEEEEGGEVYVFDDEKTAGVIYDVKGTTARAGSYYEVDAAKRNNSAVQKYEYFRMLKTEAESLGWVSANWLDKGLDGKEYSKDALIGFRIATQAEKDDTALQKYDKPSGFVPALDATDKGSDNSRYTQLNAAESDKIVGTPEEWATYKYVPAGTEEYVAKPDGWTGETYNYDFKYVSAATPTGSGYTIPSGTDSDELWFLTFSKSGSGKKYSAAGEYRLNDREDTANKYFYEKDGSEYDLLSGVGYTGETNGETTGFLWWQTFENNNNYLITFTQNDSEASPYYVVDAVPYASTGNTNRNRIASMLYTKQENYTKAEGTSGQYIKSVDRYEKDASGAYIYFDGHLYTKDSTGGYVLYKAVSGQGDGTNYYYFGSEFYRKNPTGDYVAEYDFQEKAGGEYIYWLRPVDQDYVDANSGTTFYYWKGLSYENNKKYFDDEDYKNEVTEDANWKLVENRTESYFAKRPIDPDDPDAPEVIIPTDSVTITHSNVFLKNVMNFAYQDNDPKKPLDIDRFEFAGWYTEPECINKYDFEHSVLRADITLYAKWIPKTDGDLTFVDAVKYPKAYTVKFYAKAADATESYVVENFNADLDLSKVTYVPVYNKAVGDTKDYIFRGWSTTENGTVVTEITQTAGASAGVVKLYPVWKVLDTADFASETVYTVDFYKDAENKTTMEVYESGRVKTDNGVEVTGMYMTDAATYVPTAPTGKTFAGWYTKENAEFGTDIPYDFSASVTEDITLYACWVEDDTDTLKDTKLTISFDGNADSVKTLLLDAEKQVAEEVCPDIEYSAFKADGTLAEVVPLVVNKTPSLPGNVQYKASCYKVEVKTMLPSELNGLSAAGLEELLNKADMIVVGNSNQHTDYNDIFIKYANKRGGSTGYNTGNDLAYRVVTALFTKSMEAGSAPIMLDKTLLDYRNNENTARLNAYKLFVMLQSMDAGMFYDSFLKADATNATTADLWTRIASDGTYGGSTRWYFSTFINALGLSDSDKIHYGIDKDVSLSAYPTSFTNHCYVYSGEVFKNGTEFTSNVIAKDDFYTANLFEYFNGKKAAVDNKYTPADAVNYMALGYQPEAGLNETTSFLEIQPTQTYENMRFWYLYVKKFTPNYTGKLIIKCGNTSDKYFYLGTANKDNYTNTLTIEQMTSTEFVGKLCDLSGDYRMIYLGLKEKSSAYSGNAQFMDQYVSNGAGGTYEYFHTGKQITGTINDYQGQLSLDGYSDYINQFCYPGNDFTRVKCNALLDFCKSAELPVVLDSRFFDGDDINTKLIDTSTYLYQTLEHGRVYATEPEQPGLIDLPSCFTYGDAGEEEDLKVLLNQPNLRIVYGSSSDIPPQYTVTYDEAGDVESVSGYLNPNHETERVLAYTFYLQGDPDAEYDVRMFIDMNADGKYTEATEKLDSLVVYDNTTGRYLSKYDTMTGGHNYTVRRSINDYVGVLPWKLEVYEKANPAVHYAITGMTAIKTTKKDADSDWEREKLNILQICSKGNTKVYMPSIKDIEDALGGEKDASGKRYADYTFDEFSDTQKNRIRNEMNDLGTSGVTYMFWEYLANLEEFDVEITRINMSDYALYDKIEADPLYLEQYNMLILGFADCYQDITNEKTLRAIEDFIASGKSILFTHDTTSFNNLAVNGRDPNGITRNHAGTIWGYHINRYFRNILGMDRYGSTLIYDHDRENHDEEIADKDKVFKAGTAQGTLATAKDTRLDGDPTKTLVHGYSRLEMYRLQHGLTNETTTYATKTNDGQLTKYPYAVGDNIRVATTHSQYYQLDLEADDIVVWYCLSGSSYYNNYYNDATNYYYIYNKGNITYSGVGHNGDLTDDEAKLFVNTMVAAYSASADPTAPQIINFDRTTGVDKIDYLYVDYDTIHPELAIGEGVSGDFEQDSESGNIIKNEQTKEVNFKLTENSIVTNKLMTMYVYELLTAGTPNTYKTTPMEMEIWKYTGENTTELVSAIPVFIVTEGGTYGATGEYNYEPGQVLAVDDNIIQGSGSDCYVKVGGSESKKFTATIKSGTNGYYVYDGDVEVRPQVGVDASGNPTYSTLDYIKGRIFMAPVVEAGEEYMFKAPISGLVDKDMIPYMLHVNLRYGKRQDKSKDGYKELSVVRRGLFNLD